MALTEYSQGFGTTSQQNERFATTPSMKHDSSSAMHLDDRNLINIIKETQPSSNSQPQQTNLATPNNTPVRLSSISSLLSETSTPFMSDGHHNSTQFQSTDNVPSIYIDQPATSTFGRSSCAALLSDWSTSLPSMYHQMYPSDSTLTTHSINTLPSTTPITAAKKTRRTRKSTILSRLRSCALNQKVSWASTKKAQTGTNDNNSKECKSRMTFRPYQQNRPSRRDHASRSLPNITSSLSSSSSIRQSSLVVGSSSSTTATVSTISTPSSQSFSSNMVKAARWQETDQVSLVDAIIKEKSLDDMTTFSWDRISLAVGRAKKACILPALLEKWKSS